MTILYHLGPWHTGTRDICHTRWSLLGLTPCVWLSGGQRVQSRCGSTWSAFQAACLHSSPRACLQGHAVFKEVRTVNKRKTRSQVEHRATGNSKKPTPSFSSLGVHCLPPELGRHNRYTFSNNNKQPEHVVLPGPLRWFSLLRATWAPGLTSKAWNHSSSLMYLTHFSLSFWKYFLCLSSNKPIWYRNDA